MIRNHAPYRIETAIPKAQNVVHVWAGTFQAKQSLGTIFRKVVGSPFKGAALHKTDSLTVLATYSFTIFCSHYYCPLTPPPFTPIK